MRIVLAGLLAFALVYVQGPVLIPTLHRMKFGQFERELGPASHKKKQGTPTMGGIMMLIAIAVSSLLLADGVREFVLPSIIAVIAFGIIGFLDDFIKIHFHRNLGLRAYQKLIGQILVAVFAAVWAYRSPLLGSRIYLPISGGEWELGFWYIPLTVFMILAEVNAVNLTDGLDGLSSGVMLVYTLFMAVIFVLLASGKDPAIRQGADWSMAVFSAAVAGACLGFLRYNVFPARVFMGDTGSLALGGAVSMLCICSRSFLLLPIMGFCFVGSVVSVILQIATNHLNHGHRMFKMAPIHHHFELLGYAETRIVAMYMILTTVLCAVCLLSYLR